MSAVSSTQARPRFDKGRATLSLLLLSAAVLGALALGQSGRLPGQRAGPSVWAGAPLPAGEYPPPRGGRAR